MKWESHIAIARRLFARFGYEVEQAAVKGVIEPDIRRQRYETHHRADPSRIMGYVWQAREAWLQNSLIYAASALGNALHFIHDNATPHAIEAHLEGLPIPDDAIKSGLEQATSHPFAVENIVWHIDRSVVPEKILWNAAYASAWLVQAVFSLGNVEKARAEVQNTLRKKKRDLLIATVIFVASIVISLRLRNIVPLILVGLGFIPVWQDNKAIGKICKWFALEDVSAQFVFSKKTLILFIILCAVPFMGLGLYATTPSIGATYTSSMTQTSALTHTIIHSATHSFVHFVTHYTTIAMCYSPPCYTHTHTANTVTSYITQYSTSRLEITYMQTHISSAEQTTLLPPFAVSDAGFFVLQEILGILALELVGYTLLARRRARTKTKYLY